MLAKLCATCHGPLPRRYTYRKGKRVALQFCSQRCVPRQVRIAGGQKGRKDAMLRARLALCQAVLTRRQARARRTGTELMASFFAVHARSYDNGYQAAEGKWLRRTKRIQEAA
jgi:hypothetical protein